MNIHIFKGHGGGQGACRQGLARHDGVMITALFGVGINPHHHHAGHPKENDVKARHQHGPRVMSLDIIGNAGPAKGGKWPQSRRKPCIQNIGILGEGFATGQGAGLVLCFRHINGAGVIIPRGDAMSPPQLTGNAPGLNILQPAVIGGFP